MRLSELKKIVGVWCKVKWAQVSNVCPREFGHNAVYTAMEEVFDIRWAFAKNVFIVSFTITEFFLAETINVICECDHIR